MNFKILSVSLSFTVLLALSGCWRQEVVTFRVTVTPLKSDACAQLILNRLDSIEGVEKTAADAENGWIEVSYNSTKVAEKNIEILISKLGFDANGLPGDASARENLPEACR